ncbi:MAG: exodeoxyribonuclease VII large subunit, partial [Planctomycetales bacterium]|nr:exodeoxyribonuclease VII large subunit [Planctomycetales bacterium]
MTARPQDFEPRGHEQDSPLSVSQLNWYIKNLLEKSLPSLWAEGEISDLSRPSSGHIYFTLKDDRSQIRAVIWRSTAQQLRFKLQEGLSVVCKGAIEVYPPRGSYQLIINQVQPKGIGPLQLAFQQLHAKLASQGLFAAERKQPLPKYPRRIGFVTSPSGAAIHDFLEAARRRWNDFQLVIIPARVQGDQAKGEIVRGI